MRPENRTYFPELDGLRAVAILSIFLFHLDFNVFKGGFVGVDIFFVISGFLITKNIVEDYSRGTFTFRGFYDRRIRRLFPALLFTAVISFILAALILSPDHFAEFSESLIYGLLSISNFYFYGQAGYFDTASTFKPLLHFWSLSVEEQFYMFWPGTLVLLLFIGKKRIIIPALMLLGVSSIILSEYYIVRNSEAVFYLTPFRIAEFAIGALCLWLINHNLKNWLLELGLLLGLLLIAYSILFFDKNTLFPGLRSLIPSIGTALIILSRKAIYSGSFLRSKPFLRIGLISYSLYLIHWPIIIFYKYWKYSQVTIIEKLFLAVIIITLAELMYKYIEQTFRLKATVTSRLTPLQFYGTLLVVTAIVIAPALHSYAYQGWGWRLGKSLTRGIDSDNYKCRNRKKKTEYSYTCEAGSSTNESRKLLLIGDSHAAQLIPAFDYLGKQHDVKVEVWSHNGCPPLWGTYKIYGSQDGKKREESCQKQVMEWEKAIKSNKYDYVVLANRWMWLYEPRNYGYRNVRRHDVLVDRNNPIADKEIARELFLSRLKMTTDNILQSGARAIIFSQVPLVGRNIQDCNDVPALIYPEKLLRERCANPVEYENIMGRLSFTNKTIRELASADVLSIIPSNYLCDHDLKTCYTIINQKLIYQDSNHLSKKGSLLFAMMIENEFAEFLKGK